MKKHALLFLFSITFLGVFSQQMSSPYALLYKPNFKDVEHYLDESDKTAFLESLAKQQPIDTLWNSDPTNDLPLGNGLYVLVFTLNYALDFTFVNHVPWKVIASKKGSAIQVKIFDREKQNFITSAQVFDEKKGELHFDEDKFAYTGKIRNALSSTLLIENEGDLMLVDYHNYYRNNVFTDKFNHWVYRLKRKFNKDYYDNDWPKEMHYVALNKPVFRSGDTLRFKAFVLKKNGKPQTKTFALKMSYYDRQKGESVNQTLENLAPYRPGAYKYEFYVADSLLGVNFNLRLTNEKDETIVGTSARVENYTLNKVEFNAEWGDEKSEYFLNTPMKIKYSATDDLGLSAMEGQMNMRINCSRLIAPMKLSQEQIPFVLLDSTFYLDATGRGVFSIPTDILPKSAAKIEAELSYVTADGESYDKQFFMDWNPKNKLIHLESVDGFITAVADSTLKSDQKIELVAFDKQIDFNPYLPRFTAIDTSRIQLPYVFKNLPEKWQILVNGEEELDQSDIENDFWVGANYNFDSSAVKLWWPENATVNVEIYNAKEKLVFNDAVTTDTLRLPLKTDRYYVYTNDFKRGILANRPQIISLKPTIKENYNPINMLAKGPSRIYPGDSATWNLSVDDDGKPQKEFDILAMAFKRDQFENSLFRTARTLEPKLPSPSNKNNRVLFPNELIVKESSDEQGKTVEKEWLQKLAADTLRQFKYMFPENGLLTNNLALINNVGQPQFAPFVYDKGKPIIVQAFYVNDEVKYISGTESGVFSAEVKSGVFNIKIRLSDRLITVPNVSFSLGFKTELALDINHLPDSVESKSMPRKYTKDELTDFYKHVVQFVYLSGYSLQQGLTRFSLRGGYHKYYGPFNADKIMLNSGKDSIIFPIELGMKYSYLGDQQLITKTEIDKENFKISMLYNFNINPQTPGGILQLPEKIKVDSIQVKKIQLPFSSRPKATEENGGAILPSGASLYNYKVLVYHYETKQVHAIYGNSTMYARNWEPGTYRFWAIGSTGYSLKADSILIESGSTTYFKLEHTSFELEHAEFLTLPVHAKEEESVLELDVKQSVVAYQIYSGSLGVLAGSVTDAKNGETIPFASITLKQMNTVVGGGTADIDGNFNFIPVTPGVYTIECSFLGYATYILNNVTVKASQITQLKFRLSEESAMLMEVELIAEEDILYPEEIKSSSFRGIGQLAAQAPGVYQADDANGINVRGGRSNTTVYFIDGVKVRGDINLPRSAITGGLPAQYGDARGGVISTTDEISEAENTLNTLGSRGGNVRENFRDYAFFIPDVTTDQNGEASFNVQYPDDVANWTTYFIGMDKGRKYAFQKTNTLAYSEVSAHLSTPRYLLPGDTCEVIGKNLNYLDTTLRMQNFLVQNGDTVFSAKRKIQDVVVDRMPVFVGDSVKLAYNMQLQNGFVDGEQRKIDVLPVGLEKSVGEFYVLSGDTSVTFAVDSATEITLGIMRTTTDFLLEEIELQLNYKHLCNEQMASKLRAALLVEKLAVKKRDQNRYKSEVEKLIKKLTEARNDELLWGWWSNQSSNTWMTAYVLDALAEAKKAGYEVDLYSTALALSKKLPLMKKSARVDLLFSLQKAEADAPYIFYLENLSADSLAVSQKIKWAIMAEENGFAYDTAAIATLFNTDMLGNTFVPYDDVYSLAGSLHNTQLGAQWLLVKDEKADINPLINYMLLQRRNSTLNTVSRAALIDLLATHVEDLKAENQEFTLLWDDGTETVVDENTTKLQHVGKRVTVKKRGNARAFVSASVAVFEKDPAPNTENFAISTTLFSAERKEKNVEVGQESTLQVSVTNQKEASYVMLEIPIPGACTVRESHARVFGFQRYFRELKGDKMYVYIDKLPAGTHTFEVQLLPRYAGSFTLNPVKAELMYFPVKNGNNGLQKIKINGL